MAAEELVSVALKIPADLAAEIYEKGIAEIAFRRKDKKFRQIIKAALDNSNANEKIANQVMEAVANNAAHDGKGVGKLLKNMDLGKANFEMFKNMNFDIKNALNLNQLVTSLQFVQIGLQAVNIAVDIAGIVYISKKMDGLSKQLESIADEIGKVKDIQIADIKEDCDMLRMDFNSFADKIQNGKEINIDAIENYLKRAKSFISKLVQLMLNDTIDTECILNMIFTIIPAYTSLMCVFLRAYYSEEKCTPQNYETFLEVFQELNSKKFRSAVQEYYLVGKEFNYSDVVSILDIQLMTLFNERLEIDDQLQLIEAFGDDEIYRKFEEALEVAAREDVVERTDEIAEKCGIYSDECKRILSAVA